MAKQSILLPEENRDTVLAIVVILWLIGLAYYAYTVVVATAIIAVPFIITWFWNR
jgi:hypothetical protein